MRVWVSAKGVTDTLAKDVVDTYPAAVFIPLCVVVEYGTLGWKAFGQHIPLAASLLFVANGVEYLAERPVGAFRLNSGATISHSWSVTSVG